MDLSNSEIIYKLADFYRDNNYDYVWLKTMLEKAKTLKQGNGTLITGSSHALNSVYEPAWANAVNCSMHSQDIYYDFQCAKEVLSDPSVKGKFSRCFIVMGYYIAFQDLSLSTVLREYLIKNIYYPIFKDAHNWDTPTEPNRWGKYEKIDERVKAVCEKAARLDILKYGTYYSPFRKRGSFFDIGSRQWCEVSEEERLTMGEQRANMHNNLIKHTHSFEENKQVLKEYIKYLYANDVLPIVVIPPFTPEYNGFVLPEMKEGVLELVDSVPEDVQYLDFNDAPLFEAGDFMDTDHMNEQGSRKVSIILAEMFGR